MSFPTRADHPPTCTVCQGNGWMEIEPLQSQANGDDVLYTQLAPCTHHWTGDNPDLELWP